MVHGWSMGVDGIELRCWHVDVCRDRKVVISFLDAPFWSGASFKLDDRV
jgi:hypothetical protein